MFAKLLYLQSVVLAIVEAYGGGLKETYWGAYYRCASQGKVLPAPHQLNVFDLPDITVVWLRFHKSKIFRWEKMGAPIVQDIDDTWKNTNEEACGVYYYVEDTFEATDCSRSLNFLCELPNCSECPDSPDDVIRCVNYGNTIYFYHTGAKNWSAAQDHCQSHHGSGYLSVNNNRTILKSIFKKLDQNEDNIGKVWVGFNRVGWETGDNRMSKELLGELKRIHWKKGEPSGTGNCVLAAKNGAHFAMRVADCGEPHSFYCVSATKAAATSPMTSPSKPVSQNEALSTKGKDEDHLSTRKSAEAEDKLTSTTDSTNPLTTRPQQTCKTEGDLKTWKVFCIVLIGTTSLQIIMLLVFFCNRYTRRIKKDGSSRCCKLRDEPNRGRSDTKNQSDSREMDLLNTTEANSAQDRGIYSSGD